MAALGCLRDPDLLSASPLSLDGRKGGHERLGQRRHGAEDQFQGVQSHPFAHVRSQSQDRSPDSGRRHAASPDTGGAFSPDGRFPEPQARVGGPQQEGFEQVGQGAICSEGPFWVLRAMCIPGWHSCAGSIGSRTSHSVS